jgi:hypothetical protein
MKEENCEKNSLLFSFKIASDEKIGRMMKTTKDVEANSVLITEAPLCIGPKWTIDADEGFSNFSCVGCFEPIKILHHKCMSCFWPACNNGCAGLTNPELHDIECQFLKAGKGPANKTDIQSIKEYFRMDTLLALKILLLQRKFPKKFKAIMEMESNEKKRRNTANYKEAEERIDYLETNFLKPLQIAEEKNGQVILPLKDRKTLHKIFGIIETNAMYIRLPTGTEICGLYPTASLLQHSCLPNVSYNFDMKNAFKIVVKAARAIEKGESLSTSYTHVLWGTDQRQNHLQDNKYFTCNCKRCIDPTELGLYFSALRCIGSEDENCNGIQLPTNPTSLVDNEFACTKCPVKISLENVNFITGKMNDEVENLLASTPKVNELEEMIEKLKPFLHENHYLFFNLKHTLIQLSMNDKMNDDELKSKIDMCNDLLRICNTLDPYGIRITFYISIILYEKAKCLLEMNKRSNEASFKDEAKVCLEMAKKTISNDQDTSEGKQLISNIDNMLFIF